MSYSASAAVSGLSSTFSINTGTASTPTWTLVGEISSLNLTGRQTTTADVTNFESGAREFIPVLIESGVWDIKGNRISGDAGQTAMETAFTTVPPVKKEFQIVLPKSATQTVTGDSFVFTAVIQELDYSVEIDKAVSLSCKLKVSGVLTITEGS